MAPAKQPKVSDESVAAERVLGSSSGVGARTEGDGLRTEDGLRKRRQLSRRFRSKTKVCERCVKD